MFRLKNYKPTANDIIVELKQVNKTTSGIILPKAEQDSVMKVLAVGNLVTNVQPGDWVVVGPGGQMINLPMVKEDGTEIMVSQVGIHAIIATYCKEDDEDIVFMPGGDNTSKESTPGPSNIIDNEGIEKAPFLSSITGEA